MKLNVQVAGWEACRKALRAAWGEAFSPMVGQVIDRFTAAAESNLPAKAKMSKGCTWGSCESTLPVGINHHKHQPQAQQDSLQPHLAANLTKHFLASNTKTKGISVTAIPWSSYALWPRCPEKKLLHEELKWGDRTGCFTFSLTSVEMHQINLAPNSG